MKSWARKVGRGVKSGANRKVGHKVGKREKWGEKSEVTKVGYKVGRQKWGKEKSGARNVRCDKSGGKKKSGARQK